MRYRIGEFARLAGTSIKTLRHYDAAGLLEPAGVDARTRYRFYAPEQLQDVAAIRSLRELGATLRDIRGVIGREDAGERRRLLLKLRDRARARLRETSRSLRWLDSALEADAHPTPLSIVTQRRGEIRIASIRAQLRSYADIGEVETSLLSALRPQDVGAVRGVLWHRCEASGAIEGEPFVEIAARARLPGHAVKRLPPTLVASAFCESDEAAAARTYDGIDRWMHAHEWQLAGAKRELYVGRILEIQFPLKPR